jgi:hypothetical protein
MIYSRTARNKRLLGYLVNVFPSQFYGYFPRDIMIQILLTFKTKTKYFGMSYHPNK